MKIWIDDIREPPKVGNWIWAKSVNQAKKIFSNCWKKFLPIDILSLDHDAGQFSNDGGDYIKILDWLEFEQKNQIVEMPVFEIHSMNPVGRMNMKTIIKKNGWILND